MAGSATHPDTAAATCGAAGNQLDPHANAKHVPLVDAALEIGPAIPCGVSTGRTKPRAIVAGPQ